VNTINLLKQHQLRLTKPRLAILSLFQEKSGMAISIKELTISFSNSIDKVTLYRTLHTFEENHIIHRIYDDSGFEKYALCVGTCETEHDHKEHIHGHVHFKCMVCETTECLSEAQLPEITLPDGYVVRSKNFVVFGSCKKCS